MSCTHQPWKMNALCFFKTMSNTNPATQHHLSEELNPQFIYSSDCSV